MLRHLPNIRHLPKPPIVRQSKSPGGAAVGSAVLAPRGQHWRVVTVLGREAAKRSTIEKELGMLHKKGWILKERRVPRISDR
jgi:hypothetical protein